MLGEVTEKSCKAKIAVYLHPCLARRLKRERAETDVSVSALVERIVAAYFGVELPELDADPS